MNRSPETSPPSYEQWLDYCFTQAWDDMYGESLDEQASGRRWRHWLWIERRLLVRYLDRAAENAERIAQRYHINDLWHGMNIIFGHCYWVLLTDTPCVPVGPRQSPEEEARVYRLLSRVYTQCFDRLCGHNGTDPDANLMEDDGINAAMWALWDHNGIEHALLHPGTTPQLVEPAFEAIHTALFECRTAACRYSGLYAIGISLRSSDDESLTRRGIEMVDRFLKLPDVPEWLRKEAMMHQDMCRTRLLEGRGW